MNSPPNLSVELAALRRRTSLVCALAWAGAVAGGVACAALILHDFFGAASISPELRPFAVLPGASSGLPVWGGYASIAIGGILIIRGFYEWGPGSGADLGASLRWLLAGSLFALAPSLVTSITPTGSTEAMRSSVSDYTKDPAAPLDLDAAYVISQLQALGKLPPAMNTASLPDRVRVLDRLLDAAAPSATAHLDAEVVAALEIQAFGEIHSKFAAEYPDEARRRMDLALTGTERTFQAFGYPAALLLPLAFPALLMRRRLRRLTRLEVSSSSAETEHAWHVRAPQERFLSRSVFSRDSG